MCFCPPNLGLDRAPPSVEHNHQEGRRQSKGHVPRPSRLSMAASTFARQAARIGDPLSFAVLPAPSSSAMALPVTLPVMFCKKPIGE